MTQDSPTWSQLQLDHLHGPQATLLGNIDE